MHRLPDSKDSAQTHVLVKSHGTLQTIAMLEGMT